jgi:protein-disulfide isomerase
MRVKKLLVSLSMVAALAALAFIAMPVPDTAAAAPSQAAPPAASAKSDSELKSFLQKQFRLPSEKEIELGPLKPSPIHGLWTRVVTVTNEQGQRGTAHLFIDASGTKVILGRLMDLKSDPWGRVDVKKLALSDRAALGPGNAPVTVIEFADFECPYCARAFGEIETAVNTTYKGRIHLIFKNFPLPMHPWATQAAVAAECVRRQNPEAFWNFARDIYSNQETINPADLRQRIETFASSLDLDTRALNTCMLGNSAQAQIEQDRKDGESIHINSTPTFLINGIPVTGLPSSSGFQFVLKQELKERQASR